MSGRETKWTAGPWQACFEDEDDFTGVAIVCEARADDSWVPVANVPVDYDDRPEREANARLISAAPELADALAKAQELLADLARPADGASVGNAWARCVEIELKARKALEKARGPA